MTQYARGRRKEYDVVKRLRARGWLAQRSAGSRGLWDVVAVKRAQRPRFIQVKYTAKPPNGYQPWRDENSDRLLVLGDEVLSDTPVDAEVWVYVKGVAEPRVFVPWQRKWTDENRIAWDR